jgi:hypothetical protein
MIFMNGDNNLEENALQNFADIAKLGSTDAVKIVVQFDRNGQYAYTDPQWTQTLRFLVTKGMVPAPATAVEDIGEANMGDGPVLKAFVDWAKAKYPAHHYLLDIWDHGQGWRVMMQSALAGATGTATNFRSMPMTQLRHAAPFRSISQDDTNGGDQLYNRKIQDALSGYKVDVIGFDACLMSMLETAYAMRQVAHVMVASEELEPGEGWKYDDWLKRLEDTPSMDGAALGRMLVDSYHTTYGDRAATTLAALDLSCADMLAMAVSGLADQLQGELRRNAKPIIQSRAQCAAYAPNVFGDGKDYFQHIDIGHFCEALRRVDKQQAVRQAADEVRAKLHRCVLANYASNLRRGKFGSTGIAIYFPKSGEIYKEDPYEQSGYEKENQLFPVEFVQRFHWADFLHAYFERMPN